VLARSNYRHEKRKKEVARQKAREEKLQRKLSKNKPAEQENPETAPEQAEIEPAEKRQE
jgi:hypothetical protein